MLIQKNPNPNLGLYIHFPFCVQKCEYCDFYSIGNGIEKKQEEKEIFSLYKKEILERKKTLKQNPKLDTIFFGGGTPSRMDSASLKDLLEFLKEEFTFEENIEISLEANPEDVSKDTLQSFFELGINRINIGIQSFQEKNLKKLGRYFDQNQYGSILSNASSSNIKRYGFDLIYGVEDQTFEDFREDLEKLIHSKAQHISAYSLTQETGTVFDQKVKQKKTSPPNEELQTEIFSALPKILENHGYIWYEVSNYCLENQFSKHNLKYWTMEPYLGIGPGAHGFSNARRYVNPRNLNQYRKNLERNEFPFEESDYYSETILTLFRLTIPIELESFLGFEQIQKLKPKLESWEQRKWIRWDGSIFQWKMEGILRLNERILELNSFFH